MRHRFALLLILAAFGSTAARAAHDDDAHDDDDKEEEAHAQPAKAWSLDLTVHDFGIGIGNSARVDGLRMNFRDASPSVVRGINLSIWFPKQDVESESTGLSIGLPATGAETMRGLAIGGGIGANKNFDGLGIGLLGAGAGGAIRGVVIAGLGAGSGGDVSGVAIGGLGVGAGENLNGILLGGLGAGAGGSMRGIALGGLGLGAGQNVIGLAAGGLGVGAGKSITGIALGGLGVGAGQEINGIALGGLGIGAGREITGIAIGGLGVGAGQSIRGLAIGGIGVGAGGEIDGLAIALIGVGSPQINGMTVSLVSGGRDITGFALAPAYFNVVEGGRFRGFAFSAFNRIQGEQDGVSIAIFNYAEELHGLQVGVLNWAGNNPSGFKLLPVANAHL